MTTLLIAKKLLLASLIKWSPVLVKEAVRRAAQSVQTKESKKPKSSQQKRDELRLLRHMYAALRQKEQESKPKLKCKIRRQRFGRRANAKRNYGKSCRKARGRKM